MSPATLGSPLLLTTILAWKIIGIISLEFVLWAERKSYSCNTAWSTWKWQLPLLSVLDRWMFSLQAGRIHKSPVPRPGERASGTHWSLSGSTATPDALSLPGIDPRLLGCLARSLVTEWANTCYSHHNTIIHKRTNVFILSPCRSTLAVRISNSYE